MQFKNKTTLITGTHSKDATLYPYEIAIERTDGDKSRLVVCYYQTSEEFLCKFLAAVKYAMEKEIVCR